MQPACDHTHRCRRRVHRTAARTFALSMGLSTVSGLLTDTQKDCLRALLPPRPMSRSRPPRCIYQHDRGFPRT